MIRNNVSKPLFGALAIGILIAGRSASAATIVNGGFEDPVLSNGGFAFFTPGQTIGTTGFTVLGDPGTDVLLLQTNYSESNFGVTFNAGEGLNTLDITGAGINGVGPSDGNKGPTAGVTQTVTQPTAGTYNLSFLVGTASGNASSPYQTPSTIDLSINGGARTSFTNPNFTPGAVNFQQFSTSFFAGAGPTTITFFNGTTTNNYAGLDNIVLTFTPVSVPEPGSMALLLTGGLTGAGLFFGRRRNRK